MPDPLDVAQQLARQAGKYLSETFPLSGTTASFKPDRSFVTHADVTVDRMITAGLQENFPSEPILSEELNTCLPESAPAAWIIDPLDGTTNFSLGLHVWGVLITRLVNGWPELCAMYFPLLDEMYTARRGQGAWLNGEPIHTRQPDPNQPFGFFACCSRTHHRYVVSIPYKPRILGAAAYSFCMLARGAAVIGFEVSPKIWDIAGAWLLVQESGGKMVSFEGPQPFPLIFGQEYKALNFPTLAAATPDLLESAQVQISRRK